MSDGPRQVVPPEQDPLFDAEGVERSGQPVSPVPPGLLQLIRHVAAAKHPGVLLQYGLVSFGDLAALSVSEMQETLQSRIWLGPDEFGEGMPADQAAAAAREIGWWLQGRGHSIRGLESPGTQVQETVDRTEGSRHRPKAADVDAPAVVSRVGREFKSAFEALQRRDPKLAECFAVVVDSLPDQTFAALSELGKQGMAERISDAVRTGTLEVSDGVKRIVRQLTKVLDAELGQHIPTLPNGSSRDQPPTERFVLRRGTGGHADPERPENGWGWPVGDETGLYESQDGNTKQEYTVVLNALPGVRTRDALVVIGERLKGDANTPALVGQFEGVSVKDMAAILRDSDPLCSRAEAARTAQALGHELATMGFDISGRDSLGTAPEQQW